LRSSIDSETIRSLPTLEVMISTVLVKLTVRPWPSVSLPHP